jgi:hypothetical protein
MFLTRSKLMKKSFLYGIGLVAISLTVGAGVLMITGLDDDNPNGSFDSALETKQSEDEESTFQMVANTIKAFVDHQFQVRVDKKNLDNNNYEHRLVYGDLPIDHYGTRDVHRKTNGCFRAQLNVSGSLFSDFNTTVGEMLSERKAGIMNYGPLPELLKNDQDLGVFRPGKFYDAVIRYSNGHPGNNHDRLPDARGFAVKILSDNSNAKLNESSIFAADSNQLNKNTLLDILSINFPTFFVNEKKAAQKYLAVNQYFLDGVFDFNNKIDAQLKTLDSVFLSGLSAQEIVAALAVNGSIIKSALFQDYFSMVPSRLGPVGAKRAIKYFWVPEVCSDAKAEDFAKLKETEYPLWSKLRSYQNPAKIVEKTVLGELPPFDILQKEVYPHDYLRKNINSILSKQSFCYGLYFQPYRDSVSTNIEDSSDIWFKDETQRSWWKNNIIYTLDTRAIWASKLNPLAYLDYVKKINAKVAVKPIKGAVLKVDQMRQDESAQNSAVCEDLSFNPWNGNIAYHKPLGVVSRMKRRVYNASRKARHYYNKIDTQLLQRVDK